MCLCFLTKSQAQTNPCNTKADFDFRADPDNPFKFSFLNMSLSGISASYMWTFGDGTSTVEAHPSPHTYQMPGTYSVCLRVYSANGCQDSVVKIITVKCSLTTGFTATADSLNPLSFTFTNQSTGGGNVSYTWDFGDGTAGSTTQSPQHMYPGQGAYSVSLAAKDLTNGCADAISKIVVIHYCNVLADFSSTVDSINSLAVAFKNQSTGGGNLIYDWRFGDGDSSDAADIKHAYKTGGDYPVTLNVKGAYGCQNSLVKTVTVKCNVHADFSTTVDSLNSLAVTFKNQSTGTGDLTYVWKFGDGNSSPEKNVKYTYNKAGNYNASLNVRAANGCQDSTTKAITLTAPVKIDSTAPLRDSASISVVPNPVRNSMRLYVNAAASGTYTIIITDMAGTIAKRINVLAVKGPNYFTIMLDDLQPGIYLLSARGGSQTEKIRFVKVN